MRLRTFAHLGRAAALCLLSALAASAQESPAPSPQPGKLVLQVIYRDGFKPAYETVPGSAWYANFGTAPLPVPRAAADVVRAVDVKTKLEGGRVQIRVGVHVGARFHDRLDEVATYTAAEGETVEARDLERVGVAPFVFKVLRAGAAATAAPDVVNRTQSIAASITEFTADPLPVARLTLRNLSAKRVRSVELRTVFDGRPRTRALAFEPDGKPLMEPGGTYDRTLRVTDGRTSGGDFTPESFEAVVVVSAVFEDYTYEGEAESAAMKATMDEGCRVQLRRVLPLLRKALAEPDAAALGDLKAALAALDDAAPPASVEALLKAFPSLGPAIGGSARSSIEVSMHHVRNELLNDLMSFEKQSQLAPSGNGFKLWLEAQQARYKSWLARL
jgi:hypothetical protein